MALGKTKKINHKEIDNMKKIILLVCLCVCMILVFASCAEEATEISAQDFYASAYRETATPVLQNASSLGELSRLEYQTTLGDKILVFATDSEKNPKAKFYNAETGTFIYDAPIDDIVDCAVETVYGQTFLLVAQSNGDEEDPIVTLYLMDANGSFIASQRYNGEYSFQSNYDLFKFDGCIYRVADNGTASLVVSNPFFGNFANVVKTTGYYYEIESESFTVYSHDLKEVFYWEAPYAVYDDVNISLLSNNKVLVQMIDVLPQTEEKFDFWNENGEKANYVSLLIDIEAEKEKDVEKEIDLDYLVASVNYNKDIVLPAAYADYYKMPEAMENVAVINYIEDKMLNVAEDVDVSLSAEDASVAVLIAPEFDTLPNEIAPGYFLYTSDSGNRYLLNNQFQVIGTANDIYNARMNDYYLVIDEKVYDYNFNIVADLKANEEELVTLMGKSMIVRCEEDDEVVYYLRTKDGARKEIEDYAGSTSQFFITAELNKKDGTYDYTFYNEDGTSILSVDDVEAYSYRVIYTDEKAENCIVTMTVNEKNVYYKLTK